MSVGMFEILIVLASAAYHTLIVVAKSCIAWS